MTLEIRRTPLPGPVEYFLDGAMETNEMDSCTSATLRLYADPDELADIIGRPLNVDEIPRLEMDDGDRSSAFKLGMENRRVLAQRAMEIADRILLQLDDERRGALIYDGLFHLFGQIIRISEVLADLALTDEVQGGGLEKFKKIALINRRGEPHRRLYRKLCSPSFIRRYTKGMRTEELYTLRVTAMFALNRTLLVPAKYIKEGAGVWRDMEEQLVLFREHRRMEVERRDNEYFRAMLGDDAPRKKAADPKRKKILKRASAIASSVLGRGAVSALARGESIKVDGPTLALKMQKRGFLSDAGHGVLSVDLVDHGGAQLASLCVYQDSIPAIDQAVGFALMVQSGLEKEFLEEANVTSVTARGAQNELISEKQKVSMRRMVVADGFLNGNVRMGYGRIMWGHEACVAWRQRYWNETRMLWNEAVAVVVLGRSLKRVVNIVDNGRLQNKEFAIYG